MMRPALTEGQMKHLQLKGHSARRVRLPGRFQSREMVGGIMEKFIEHLQNAESHFLKYEEERHRSDREHEERMIGMIAMMCQPKMPPPQAHM